MKPEKIYFNGSKADTRKLPALGCQKNHIFLQFEKHCITWIWRAPCFIFSYHIGHRVRHQLTLWPFQRSQSAGPNLVPLSDTLVKSSSHFWGYRRHKKKACHKTHLIVGFQFELCSKRTSTFFQVFSKSLSSEPVNFFPPHQQHLNVNSKYRNQMHFSILYLYYHVLFRRTRRPRGVVS